MEYNVHNVLKKLVTYYTRKHKKFKNQFLVMDEIVIIFKDKKPNL